MAKIITSKIRRGSLIHYSLDNIKRESFDAIKKELKDTLKDKAGVYALYKGDRLVRVGLGTNIFWRLMGHSKNVRLNWDNASLFIIGKNKLKYLRDLETAIVRIAKPKYNNQQGRIKDEHYLERFLRRRVKEKRRKLRDKRRKKDKELRELEKDIAKIEKVIS